MSDFPFSIPRRDADPTFGNVTVAGKLRFTRVEIPVNEDAFIEPEIQNEGNYEIGRNGIDANRGNHFRKILLHCGYRSGETGEPSGDMFFIKNDVFKSWGGISSDSRIKENQTEYKIEDSMNIVKSLKVKKYFNVDSQKEEMGLIAQEVEKILPDAVTISDLSEFNKDSDFRFLDYDKVLVHTLGAIQLLEERLATLENK